MTWLLKQSFPWKVLKMDSSVGDCSVSEGVEVGEPPKKTPVSILQEFCTAFDLGAPFYNLEGSTGEAHDKVFQMSLIIPSLEISGKQLYISVY